MEHLNQTSCCCSLSAAALLISRTMFAWMGRRGFTGNTMLRSSLCAPAPLLSLSSVAEFYMHSYIYIISKGRQISFPMHLKKHKQQEQDPKNASKKSKNFLSSTGPLPHQATSTVTGVQSTPGSAILPQNSTSSMTGIEEDLHFEDIDKSQKIYTVKPIYIINIIDYSNKLPSIF